MLKWIKQKWDDTKAWFNYAWSIFIARAEVAFGLLTAVALSVDWNSLLDGVVAAGDWVKGLVIGGVFVLKGLISEIGRRAGTVTLSDGQLIPAQIDQKAEAIKVIKSN